MRILWVATKPPWPPRDGGRLVLAQTVACLREAGHVVQAVAPGNAPDGVPDEGGVTCVQVQPRPWPGAALRALFAGLPVSIARHDLPAVRRAVARAIRNDRWDVVVAEQLQALPQCAPAHAAGLPVVLRAQNVESDLWAATAETGGWRAALARVAAGSLTRYEALALARVAAVAALTPEDAQRLRELAPPARVHVLPAPFPTQLPAADAPLAGAPALVVLAGGWRPNFDGARWFVERCWPTVRASVKDARLHVFGAPLTGPGVIAHPAPADSRGAFAPGSLHVVPLRVASGVRIKILEAWARGIPVVATSRAAAGLGARHGQELLLADDADAFTAAVGALSGSGDLGPHLTAAGRARLATQHAPQAVAEGWVGLLSEVVRRR